MNSLSAQLPLSQSSRAYAAPSPTVSMVAPASSAALSATAASLASDAGITATIGAAPTSGFTYDAAGLFNSLVQAEISTGTTQGNAATPAASLASVDQAVLGSLSAASSGPILYSASGGLQAPTVDVNASLAGILKTDPGIAGNVINDSFDQGIIASMSISA